MKAAPLLSFVFEIQFSFFCQSPRKPRQLWVSAKNRNQLEILAWLAPLAGGLASTDRKIFFASWLTRKDGCVKIQLVGTGAPGQ